MGYQDTHNGLSGHPQLKPPHNGRFDLEIVGLPVGGGHFWTKVPDTRPRSLWVSLLASLLALAAVARAFMVADVAGANRELWPTASLHSGRMKKTPQRAGLLEP